MAPLREDFSLSSSALIGLLVIAVAIATVIVISLVMLRKRQYGTISHGIVEVSSWAFFRLGPELARVSSMLVGASWDSNVGASGCATSLNCSLGPHFVSQPQLNCVASMTRGCC